MLPLGTDDEIPPDHSQLVDITESRPWDVNSWFLSKWSVEHRPHISPTNFFLHRKHYICFGAVSGDSPYLNFKGIPVWCVRGGRCCGLNVSAPQIHLLGLHLYHDGPRRDTSRNEMYSLIKESSSFLA